MSTPGADVKARIDAIESSYEYFLAYAAQGLTAERAAKSGGQLLDFVGKMEKALDGLGDVLAEAVVGAPGPWDGFVPVVARDAESALAALRMVAAQEGISSQLIDNLNANIHLRALLTDLFLVDEILE